MTHLLLPHMQIEDRPGFTFFDVMTGGGSVSLAVARTYRHVSLHINDLDENMHAFWKVVAAGSDEDYTKLIKKLNVKPTMDLFNYMLEKEPGDIIDRAFRAMFFSRASHISAVGKRPLGGWTQVKGGIDSRWNYESTIKHILEARRLLMGRTTVTGNDFASVLTRSEKLDCFVYCDPPYYVPGNELYHTTQWEHADHVRLRRHLNRQKNWLLSYDDVPAVRKLYVDNDISTLPMKYSAGKRRKKVDELLIKPKETSWQEQETLTGESPKTDQPFQP